MTLLIEVKGLAVGMFGLTMMYKVPVVMKAVKGDGVFDVLSWVLECVSVCAMKLRPRSG